MPVTVAVGVGTIVQALLILTAIAIIPCIANTATDRKLNRAPPVAVAFVWTVLNTTVIANKRWCTLALAESVTDAICDTRNLCRTRFLVIFVPKVFIAIGI